MSLAKELRRISIVCNLSELDAVTLEDAADEIQRLRDVIRGFIKAEQDLQDTINDYFVVNYDEEVEEAHEKWKASWRALEQEANRGL